MRLIDADSMKTIHEIQMANFNSIEGIQEWIDRQPTAFDIDKVVAELEKKINDDSCDGIGTIWGTDAIEIVNKGGVSDDVCEWEHSPTDNNVIRPFHHKYLIGMYEDVLCKFPYCPYCGKKIKVV